MFRHRGKTRTLKHNLQIASLLSFVAGIVNVAGFLSVQRLTTNVTGHFAFLVDEVFKFNIAQAVVMFLYIFCFFVGSFVSGLLFEIISRKSERFIYIPPVVIELIMLTFISFSSISFTVQHPDVIACSLLFAMGLQNSLVTTISDSMVRTTHLTGLFTDLGIELSQLFYYTHDAQRKKLFSSIKLRLTIILFFFLGGISSGLLFKKLGIRVLLLASFLLLAGLIFDTVKFQLILLTRKIVGVKMGL